MNFADLSQEELCQQMENLSLPKFRGKQLYDAIINAQSLDEISVFFKRIEAKF